MLFVTSPDRDATVSEYEQRIRQYLGYRQFDHAVQERLTHWLEARATEGPLTRDILHRAEDQLRAWRVVCRDTQRLNAWSLRLLLGPSNRSSSISR